MKGICQRPNFKPKLYFKMTNYWFKEVLSERAFTLITFPFSEKTR
jgi:hypothetical protein